MVHRLNTDLQADVSKLLLHCICRLVAHRDVSLRCTDLGRYWRIADMPRASRTFGCDAIDAVDGAHSAASKCHRVVASKRTTLRGAVHGRG
jgi:hypothetical protein